MQDNLKIPKVELLKLVYKKNISRKLFKFKKQVYAIFF